MTSSTLNIDRLANGSGLSANDRARRLDDLSDFLARLRAISERARKLLVQIAQMAYHGRGEGRRSDVAYLPELYESTGLDVESMYQLLKQLQAQRFVQVEDPYPFEDVKILPCASGWNALEAMAAFSEKEAISMRDIIVDLRFDQLR